MASRVFFVEKLFGVPLRVYLLPVLLGCSLAQADDHLFLVSADGKVYRLEKSLTGARKWKEVSEKERDQLLSSPELTRVAGETGSARPDTSVVVDGQSVKFKFSGASTPVLSDSGLKAPPPGMEYSKAHLDADGNLFVELGGNGSGLNYLGAGGGPFIPAKSMQLDSGAMMPEFAKILPNPYGAGVVGRTADGALWRLEPPTVPRGPFHVHQLAAPGQVQEIALANGKLSVLTQGGKFGELTGLSDFSRGFTEIGTPKEVSGTFRLVSSYESGAGNRIRAHLQSVAQAAPPAAFNAPGNDQGGPRKPANSGDEASTRFENRNGKLVRLDAQGKELPHPVSVFEGLRDFKPAGPLLMTTERVFNDDLANDRYYDRTNVIFGREDETMNSLDTLVRHKGKNPVLVGEPGVGKTAIAERIAQIIEANDLPGASEYQRVLRNAIIIETTPGAISKLALSNDDTAQAAAVSAFVKSVKAAEKELGRRIIVYVDEMHMFSPAQLEALKTTLDSSDGILFLGSTTHGEYQQMLGRNGALERRLQQVPVREFNATETRELLKKSVVPMLEKKYSGRDAQGAVVPGKINDEAIDVAIRRSREYLPNSNRPEGPFKLLQDAMVRAHRKAGSQAPVLTDKDVSRFVVDRLQLPLDPGDPKNFYEGIEKVKGDLREKVVDQHRVTDAMVDLWQDVQMGMGSKDHHKVMLVAGPTGAGKTFSAQQFAKAALGSEDRFLEIDATKYSTGGLSLNSLIGAPPGVESSQNFKGILPEFLAGKGKGANVIVINEIDKAHPDLMKTLMEMLDSGKLQGGDGKTYQLGKSLIVLTTNKGDDRIYPRGTKGALSRKDIEARLDKITDRDVRGYFMEPNADDLYNTSQKLPPSVLNRIDRAVAAAPPSREGAIKVARQEVARLSGEYEQNYRYKIAFDNAALERMVDGHYVPEDGVRDLVRAVKAKVNETVKVAFNELGVGAGDTLSVSLQLGAHGEPGSFVVSKGGSSKHASIKAPAAISSFDNPLMDPEARQGLVTLEKRLGERVFGQEDAVKMSTRAIKNQLVNAQGNQPARLLYLGSTGTGKTELGKAIAKEHYGNEGKMIAFDMGNVKWEGDMNNIFGSPQGIAGSNKTSPFEQFLQDHPDGGVIIFDEIGNMGGARGSGEGNADKESMLKKFYGMLDEGRWVNAHGKRYDLSKYTLVFTSNEGQEVYNGLPSDDLRVAAWKGSKDRDSLNQILKKHGWPEALIARFNGNISLFKPLVVDERAMVAKKMVDKAVSGLTAQHGIKEITTDPDFYKEMGDAFFSHEEGARAMKIVSEGAMSDIIGDAILNNYDPERFKNSSLHLSLKDNYRGKFSFKGKVPPKREVKLSLQFKGPDGVQEYSVDLADQAVAKRLASRRSLLRTAYHEAGHAVANDPVVTGKKVDFITVRGQGGYGGYARYKNVGSVGSLSRESTIQEIGGLLAGREAEKMRGFGPDSGWTSDLEKARKLAQDAVTQYGLTDHALGLPVENGKVKVAHPKVQAEIQELLQEGEAYARDKLTRHWAQIRGVTEKLMKDGYMDGDDFEKTISLASAKASGTGVLDRHKSPPKDSCRDAFIRLLGK